jgi:predicted dinucleotide-binding enzyme
MTKSQVEAIRGLRNPADPKHAALPKKRVKAPAEAVKEAEVAVITTSWSAAEAAIKSLGNLRGQLGDPALRGRKS